MKIGRNNTIAIAGGFDGKVIIWDVRTSKVISAIRSHSDPITSVDISHDSTLFLTSSYDGTAR